MSENYIQYEEKMFARREDYKEGTERTEFRNTKTKELSRNI